VADYLAQLQGIATDVAQARGARVFVKLNAWPDEIELIDARSLDQGQGGPGIIQGQLIVRDQAGRVITKFGPEVSQNWLLTGAIVAGVSLLLFVIIRGMLPHRKG
jgi:hypothetical protein